MATNNRIDNIGGVWYFPLYDNNGNITDYVSETGEVVASYAYDAFGRTIAQSGAMADVFPFRFSTKYYDAESGLYYYGYRYYSPELGRWLTRDPIEEDGGDNLYAFCENNGVDAFDALGLKWAISRTGDNFALAQGSYDSIHSLADIIGLAVGDYKKWASPLSEPIPNSPYQIIQCIKLRIPNTVIAYWAGDLGSFGKWWVNYNDGVEHLRGLGFRVNSFRHGEDVVSIPIQRQLMSATRGKWLQGFYFWGHGYRPYPSSGLTNSNGDLLVDYSSISLSYKLGITLLFACDSNSGMGSIASFSPGAIRVGHTGTLYPVNPWGYRVSDYIRHGDQGTK